MAQLEAKYARLLAIAWATVYQSFNIIFNFRLLMYALRVYSEFALPIGPGLRRRKAQLQVPVRTRVAYDVSLGWTLLLISHNHRKRCKFSSESTNRDARTRILRMYIYVRTYELPSGHTQEFVDSLTLFTELRRPG